MPDNSGTMRREDTTIKGQSRQFSKAGTALILALRLDTPPMNRLSFGNQSKNIRLINRRVSSSLLLAPLWDGQWR